MIYLYEIVDWIWNFVTDFSWVFGLIVGLYVLNHTVNQPIRTHKLFKKELQNIKSHYELLSQDYDLSEPEGRSDFAQRLDSMFLAAARVSALVEYAGELGQTPRSRTRWSAIHALVRGVKNHRRLA